MSEREQALAQIVSLAEQHALTHQDVRRALAASQAAAGKPRQGILGRLFGYIGGTLVLAGLCVFIATLWGDMNSLERIIVTLGPGLAALVLSFLASLSAERQGLVTPLFLIGALAEPAGIVTALREYSTGGNETLGALAVAGTMALQCVLFFVSVRRGSVLFFALLYGCVALASALALLELDGQLNALVVGISLFLVSVAVARGEHEPITPVWFFLSSTLILGAWFSVVEGGWGEISEVVLAAVFVYLSTALRSRTLLAAGTLGLLVYIGYFSGRFFADSVGWPLLLILLGVVMMGLGTAAVRIHRRYIRVDA